MSNGQTRRWFTVWIFSWILQHFRSSGRKSFAVFRFRWPKTMPPVSWKTIMDLKWFIFLVLTAIILKLLHRQHVIMIILMDWPITVGHQWPLDLIGIQTAMSKQKSTISKIIDGTTLLIILSARKYSFMNSAFLIYGGIIKCLKEHANDYSVIW